ncbi:MAG: M6 family metalloprotease domain-containing protein [Bacteroidales bacterium]
MKTSLFKQFTIMLLISFVSVNLFAIPANPKPITIKQPNGKTITLTLKGDEKVNWATTIDQYTLVRNSENVFVYAQLNERGDLVPSNFIASNSDERTAEERLFLSTLPFDLRFSNRQIQERKTLYQTENTHKAVTSGQIRLLLILVGFSDKPFSYTQSDFNNMCNQVGYNTNGATGSVRDYYYDNSGNALEMIIDVVGPVTLPNTSAYYAANGGMGAFVSGALTLADPSVDFSQYLNGQNRVSNIHFVFAGQPQSSTGNTSEIWPHKSYVSQNIVKDGVYFSSYSCSAEKKNSTQMDGIGTMSHEMGHALGLMDLYDTDYTSSGGTAATPDTWCLMASGSYNNNSNTPPYLNAWEREILGWGNPINLTSTTTGVLPCVADSLKSYRINISSTEYFLLEHRKQKGWDAYIPGNGMIIYHGDRNRLEGTDPFYYNDINVSPSDRGFYIEVATGNLSHNSTSLAPFGGASGQNYFTNTSTPATALKDGTLVDKPVTHISYLNDSTMTFNFVSNMPQVRTMGVDAQTIMGNSATVSGSIVYFGIGAITERGFYWHTDPDSANAITGTKVISSSTDTTFTANLTSLPYNTIIYYRAYASNSSVLNQAIEVLNFTTTDGLGTLITSNPTSINNNGATLNASLISVGDAPLIAKGFVYSTNSTVSPTLENDSVLTLTDPTLGAYSYVLGGLTEQTTYYYRSYVTTSVGTKYGSRKSFTTTFPAIVNNTISNNQEFCGQGTPNELIGQVPTGGYGSFAYKWEQRIRNGSWSDATQTNNQPNYQPELITDSTFYRRITFSNNLKDTSNTILINIKNSWGGVLDSPYDTINEATTTGAIRLTSKIGTILNWERKKDNEDWTIIDHTATQLSQTIDSNGVYTYRVKVQKDNCPEAYSSEREIYVKDVLSITDIDFNIQMKVYPNPSKGIIKINSSYSLPVQLRIINSLGQVVKSEITSIQDKELDLTDLENGTYLLSIMNQGKQTTKTIIINK